MALCFAIYYMQLSVDAFNLFYSNLLHAKLRLFVFVATMLHRIGNLLVYVTALFVTGV